MKVVICLASVMLLVGLSHQQSKKESLFQDAHGARSPDSCTQGDQKFRKRSSFVHEGQWTFLLVSHRGPRDSCIGDSSVFREVILQRSDVQSTIVDNRQTKSETGECVQFFVVVVENTLFVPDCNLEPETGSCRGSLRRFYFHPSCEECDTFTYGGCGGNANNFKSIEECEKTCFPVCKLKPVTGRCRAAFRRYFYDPDSERCKKFIYGGCGGNANNFKTKAACEKECVPVCELKPEVGRCRGRKRRFFYDPDTKKCKKFFYGGCGGNANKFKTKAACEKECVPVCELKPKVGRCKARKRRFFYNSDSQKCEEFFYGGCDGNANNFKSVAECEETCIPVCNLKPEVGRCRAAIPRFFYDPDTDTCKKFTYGGCGGNGNNFKTKAECEDRCA